MRRERPPLSRPIGLVVAAILAGGPAFAEAPGGKVDFRRDVLPILSDKCFQCHGPDPAARKADLRLDTKEGALKVEGAVIVPGRSGESELFSRLTSKDADEVMPPPKANRDLEPGQVETIRRWIDQGAEWTALWSFESLKRPVVPEARSGAAWAEARSTASSSSGSTGKV